MPLKKSRGPRDAATYRGARRNEAKRRKLLWREVAHSHAASSRRARSDQVWVILPTE